VEIIGVDCDAYRSTFYDSFGNLHSSRMEIDGTTIRWLARHSLHRDDHRRGHDPGRTP
jgi:hypothetical protein